MTLYSQDLPCSWDTLLFNLIVSFAAVSGGKKHTLIEQQILISHLFFTSADTGLLWLGSAHSPTETERAAPIQHFPF